MTISFRLAYAIALAIFLILLVIFGQRTFYSEPAPEHSLTPYGPPGDQEEYFDRVFIIAGVLGVAAIAAGVYLFRRVEALPLGFVLGGIGVVIYGWVESARGPGEMNTGLAFIVAAIGFAVLVAGGYWFFGARERGKALPEQDRPPPPGNS